MRVFFYSVVCNIWKRSETWYNSLYVPLINDHVSQNGLKSNPIWISTTEWFCYVPDFLQWSMYSYSQIWWRLIFLLFKTTMGEKLYQINLSFCGYPSIQTLSLGLSSNKFLQKWSVTQEIELSVVHVILFKRSTLR